VIYPKHFEEKIGFNIIRKLLTDKCLTRPGKSFVEKMKCSSDIDCISNNLDQVAEFIDIITSEKNYPLYEIFDFTDELNRVSIPGTFLEPEVLIDLKTTLQTLHDCIVFFDDPEHKSYVNLCDHASKVYIDSAILLELDKIVDAKGNIKDAASATLKSIRSELRSKIRSSERLIAKTLEQSKHSGWSGDEAEITIRDGRLVIPVKVANKRKIKGFIHDESATGQTVFMEPEDCFDLNNDIRELYNSEKREIIKILTGYTNFLRPFIPTIFDAFRFIGLMDFIRAKAKLSLEIDAVKPKLHDKPLIRWINAIHPILYLNHKNLNKPTVPLDIELTDKERTLVISGPNAGGKSVCLKTVGLLQY